MNTEISFSGRLAVQQRVLPGYRAAFFEILAEICTGGLSVFAGDPKPEEQITSVRKLSVGQYFPAVNHHFLKVSSPFYQCRQPGILEWLEGWDPEALIVEANPRYPSTRRAVDWMHSRGRPVLGWGLGAVPLSGLLKTWRLRSRHKFLRRLDGIIAYSLQGAQEYQAVGFSPERVFVAPNAVARKPTARPPIRPQILSEQPRLLFVGRLQQRKRIDLLLKACAGLSPDLQPRLSIVGDGPARAELEVLSNEFYPQAEFVGALFGPELDRLFFEADLFVLPGTGGLAVQEAMSHGLPVIVARGDGTQGDLVRPQNGWIIPSDDLNTLTAALHDALADPSRLRRMGDESYRIVSEEINLENMAASFVHALNEVTRQIRSSTANPVFHHQKV